MQIPNLVVGRRAKLMLRAAVNTHPSKEVQGFGKLSKDEKGDLWVTDIIIPPHEVTATTVELKPEVIEKFWLMLAEQNEVAADYPLWWHSHAGMGTIPSSTDTTTLDALAQEFGGVAFGLVTNVREEYYSWLSAYVNTDYGKFFVSREMKSLYEPEEDAELTTLVAEMMKEVTEQKHDFVAYNKGGFPAMEYGKWKEKGKGKGKGKGAKPGVELQSKAELEDFYKMAQASYPPPIGGWPLAQFIAWFNDEENDVLAGWREETYNVYG